MIINNARFEITAVKPEQYPVSSKPEIALIGRSNAGKSSLINTLFNRKNLARVAAKPGKTREINFYDVDDITYFVDLPGYGYASVSKDKKSSWGTVVETYINTRFQLKLVLMLVDIRHEPSKDDKLMYEWIVSHNLNHIVVATKMDKVTKSQVNIRLKEIRASLNIKEDILVTPFSSLNKQGKEELLARIGIELGL